MNIPTPTIESVEKYISYLQDSVEIGAKHEFRPSNLPLLQHKLSDKEYDALEKKSKYLDFVNSADIHYFISRILFLHRVYDYSFFCGFQCIENYLKAYLKYKGEPAPRKHSLSILLIRCRSIGPCVDSFINSDSILTITEKYAPFYELARYPIQSERPEGPYIHMWPQDIYLLDYFVMKMREILPIPPNHRDILKGDHFNLWQCKENYPDFYNTFYIANINFIDKDQR